MINVMIKNVSIVAIKVYYNKKALQGFFVWLLVYFT